MKKYLYLCSIMLLFLEIIIPHNVLADGIDSSARTGKIIGSIASSSTVALFGGADISLRDSGGNVIDCVKSDDEGNYAFENVPEGTGYSISCSHYCIIYREPDSIDNITVYAGETTVVEQQLNIGTICPVGVKALLDPAIYIRPAWGYAGGEAAVDIYTDNIEGMYMKGNEKLIGFRLCINYDSELLTPISIENGALLGNDELSYEFLPDRSCITAEWMSDEPVDSNDVLFTIKFRIDTGITDGSLANVHCDNNGSVMIYQSLKEHEIISKASNVNVVIKTLQNEPCYDAEIAVTQNGLERNSDSISGSIECDIMGAFSDNKNVAAIAAVYSDEGNLLYCQLKEILEPDGDKESVVFDNIDVITDTNECLVKIFCWDTDSGITPIVHSVSFGF